MRKLLEDMGINTLPTMTEFIKIASAYQRYPGSDRNLHYWSNTMQYMELITQRLRVDMFLPCDSDGLILKKPTAGDMQYKVKTNFKKDREYDNAMAEVIFSGWSQSKDSEHMDNGVYEIDLAGNWRVDKGLDSEDYIVVIKNASTIEDLINAGVELELSKYEKEF